MVSRLLDGQLRVEGNGRMQVYLKATEELRIA